MKKVKRYGLGGSIGTAAGLALNFIPGVGPIASAIATPLLSAAGDAIEKKIEDNKVKPNNLTPVGQLPDMTGNTQMFRNGGKPQLRTISGPKHENGGVPLRDKNGRVIGEVEGGETKVVKNGQPEFIFSDSIVVPNTNQTFADMSKQIKNNKQGLKALASMQERVKGVPTSGPMFKDGGKPRLVTREEYLANRRPTIYDKIDNAVGNAVGGAFTNDPYKRDWWEGTEVKLKKPVAPVRDTNQSLRTIAPNPTLELTQRQSTRPATQQPVATTAPAATTVPATSPTVASGSTRKPASSSSGSSSYGETRFNALSAGPMTPMPSRTPSTNSEMSIMGKKEITPELAAGLKPSATPSGRSSSALTGGLGRATAVQTALPLIGGAINLRSFSKDMMPDLKENAGFTAARALMPDRFSLDAARTDVKQSERNANAMIGRNAGSASSMMAYSLANRNRSNSAYNQIAQQEEQGNNALKMAKAELELKAGADKQAVQNQLSMLDAQRRQNRILSITDALMGAASNYYAGQYDAESLRLTDKTARPGVTDFMKKKFGGKVKRY